MIAVRSYVAGEWVAGAGGATALLSAVTGEPVAEVRSGGFDAGAALRHAREVGGPALRRLTFHQRALLLKELAAHLSARKEEYYRLSTHTGATRQDKWMDVDGGFGTLFTYSSKARRELPNDDVLVDGAAEPLSKRGTFVGRHVYLPRRGAAVQINAFNFPVWGMLEKLAPAFIAGVPTIAKPATVTSFVAHRVAEDIVASGLLPPGTFQFLAGGVGDLLEHLTFEDSVSFTGSASTAALLRDAPAVRDRNVHLTLETDSLNSCILGPDVGAADEECALFVEEIAREMTIKSGQRCTAIRRCFVPAPLVADVVERLRARLGRIVVGDPSAEGVDMGPLVSLGQRDEVTARVAELAAGCERVELASEVRGNGHERGAFFAPALLVARDALRSRAVHEVEAFGPVTSVLGYTSTEELIELVARGGGSLVSTVVTNCDAVAREIVLGIAPAHGRVHLLNRRCAAESTGHGSPLPHLIHGGPGRAGGGEELGGIRGIQQYMQRTALQGSPTTLGGVYHEYTRGGEVREDGTHPFAKYLDELQVGDSILTHRRTITEADLTNFAGVSGDFFYAHMDEPAARESLFGKRVAHGYFVLAAAAGLFVRPGPGPVLANYGLEGLRFTRPAAPGDTLQVRLTCKAIRPKEGEDHGVVEWDVVVRNQDGEEVAVYTLLTLVRRRPRGDAA
ncbi:MAG TPA: phenylacetic acid degradation bifunctional protein PaaZ [Candidatus Saccharimonadales bacterium]|nr:phenylacetic acid degradation bifunctional protein PaaZ [Candidatus Saccharimonadales bacterium]